MHREPLNGSDPAAAGSAPSAMAASSGAETTYELIDPLSADHSQIPKTPPIDNFNDHNFTDPDESNPPTWDKSKTGLLHSSGFWISLCALLL
jgi:hypothetical protein